MKTVFIVDDDPSLIRFVKTLLPSARYRVESALSAREALEFLSNRSPNVILLDVRLAEENGLDFLEDLKKLRNSEEIPVIMLTGERAYSSVVRAGKTGIADYVLKPIDPTLLLERIDHAVHAAAPLIYRFDPEEEDSEAVGSLACEIVHTNEIGLLVETKVKLAVNEEIFLNSLFLDRLEIKDVCFMRTSTVGRLLANGQFINEVSVIGMPPENIASVRRRIK